MDSNRLPTGRHQLSRDQVRDHQRDRIFRALESVMATQGYVETSVADVLRHAGVSRQTFYELFTSKQDCFLAGYSARQGSVIELIFQTPPAAASMDRFASLLRTYLAVMAADPGLSRLYLIGVYAAGPDAIAKRLDLQQQFVNGVADVFDARTSQQRFTCQALVAAISTLVTNALLEADPGAALADLHAPLLRIAGQLLAPGHGPPTPSGPAHSTKR